jgi:chemotaxis family two-component system response regulator Rcp1
VKIFLIEDNEPDIILVQYSFQALKIPHDLQVARRGEEAVDLLKIDAAAGRAPSLILLDLNMPGMTGLETLEAIRGNPKLRAIPVIVMSSSQNPQEVLRAYESGANAYITKPASNFVDMIGDIDRFWLRRAELPVRQFFQR